MMDLIFYGLTTIRAVSAWLSTTSGRPIPQLLFAPEFPQITVILAYVPGPDYNLVADWIADFLAVT